MTAIVGILNKRAVAIAADSAVTVTSGDNRKIYNTSQKIFKLSEKNPVAIMTYSNTSTSTLPPVKSPARCSSKASWQRSNIPVPLSQFPPLGCKS